jgi:hypothetical protein
MCASAYDCVRPKGKEEQLQKDNASGSDVNRNTTKRNDGNSNRENANDMNRNDGKMKNTIGSTGRRKHAEGQMSNSADWDSITGNMKEKSTSAQSLPSVMEEQWLAINVPRISDRSVPSIASLFQRTRLNLTNAINAGMGNHLMKNSISLWSFISCNDFHEKTRSHSTVTTIAPYDSLHRQNYSL